MPRKARKKPHNHYVCKWCGETRRDDKYYKCAIDNEKFICKDCLKQKYKDLSKRCSKENTLLILCHYLDLPFYWEICKSLCVGEDIGIYIRQCNIAQYDLTSFEDGFLQHELDYQSTYFIDKAHICNLLDNLKANIETIKSEI